MAEPRLAPTQLGRFFDAATDPGGYAWWYADGLSLDGNYGFTLIAFIGSVFSPYYAWSRRADPYNHCAFNLALYGRSGGRWTMTERGRGDLDVSDNRLGIGPSAMDWNGETLTIDIAERGMPVPRAVRGQIRLRPRTLNAKAFDIDTPGQHFWQPIAPSAEVDVRFTEPGLRWTGDAYMDTNRGSRPLEEAFRSWNWSRVHGADGRTGILYNTVERSGAERNLALVFAPGGGFTTITPPPRAELPPTPVFRIKRTTRANDPASVRLGRTLEDTPFYSRSIIESDMLGERCAGIHESFDGDRLAMPLVKLMLPFRMPRRPIRK
ncbi:MAG: hypothetical protein RLO80_02710 [Hyphomonas sp.]